MNRKSALLVIRKYHEAGISELVERATLRATERIKRPRFWETERGFHGEFHSILRQILTTGGIIRNVGPLLEQEYQKTGRRHETTQRPDSILHMPAVEFQLERNEGNFAVWALKRRATKGDARDDFIKLETMFRRLNYPLGFFLNIAGARTYEELYQGHYPERVHCMSCRLREDGVVEINHKRPRFGR